MCEGNINFDPREKEWNYMDWINVTDDLTQRLVVANTVIKQ
jgi:hypothetical protein